MGTQSEVTLPGTRGPNAPRGGGSPTIGPGTRLGRFVVLDEIGRGGMGAVYAAFDPKLDRKVALKVLVGVDVPAQRRRLLREAKAAAGLSHPNVVTVYDAGTDGDRPFVAMEFVRGQTLERWLRDDRPDRQAIVEAFLAAGRGLAAAHAAGIVHRDFKPGNVLIGPDGRALVTDFGLARPVPTPGSDQDLALSDIGTAAGFVGTPAYMAPEQFEVEPVDARADQFSFCVALWEALCREHPFVGRTPAGLAVSIVANERRPGIPSSIPRRLRAALERGLARDPGDRFPSMQHLLAALGAPSRAARLGWAVAVLGGASVVAIAARPGDADDPRCDVPSAWSAEVRDEIGAAFAASGPRGADHWERLQPRLEAYTARLVRLRSGLCQHGPPDDPEPRALYDERLWCLDNASRVLDAQIDLWRRADEGVVTTALWTIARFPALEACESDDPPRPFPPSGDPEDEDRLLRLLAAGRARAAAQQEEAALEIYETLTADAPVGHPVRAIALRGQATARWELGHLDQAEQDLWASLEAAYRAADRHEAARTWAALILLTGTDLGRHEQALRWVPVADRAARGDATALAELYLHVANVRFGRGEHATARRDYERSLAYLDEIRHLPAVEREAQLNNLGAVLGASGDLEGASRYFEQSLSLIEATYGDDSPEARAPLNNLARVAIERGQLDEAQRKYERAEQIGIKWHGPDDRRLILSIQGLASVAEARGRPSEALAYARRVQDIKRASLPPQAPAHALSDVSVADLLIQLGEVDEAIRLIDGALEVFQRSYGREHQETVAALVLLSDAQLVRGDLETALATARDAQAAAAALPDQIYYHAAAALAHARIDLRQGRFAQALGTLDRAATEAAMIGQRRLFARIAVERARALRRTGHPNRAIAAADEARIAVERRGGEPHLLCEARFERAQALATRNRPGDRRAATAEATRAAAACARREPPAPEGTQIAHWLERNGVADEP